MRPPAFWRAALRLGAAILVALLLQLAWAHASQAGDGRARVSAGSAPPFAARLVPTLCHPGACIAPFERTGLPTGTLI